MVIFDVFVALDPLPGISFDFKEPTVVQTAGLVGVATENEDSLLRLVVYCGVLGAWSWELITLAF